jgi:hypothetical protein
VAVDRWPLSGPSRGSRLDRSELSWSGLVEDTCWAGVDCLRENRDGVHSLLHFVGCNQPLPDWEG